MTKPQRITLLAEWWPKAAKAQGWNKNDRAQRIAVLSAAVGRTINSASDLNNTDDVDKVKAHLGMLADNVQATIETDEPDLGRARRLRYKIAERLKCLAVYVENADAYLAELVKDKFKHGTRASANLPAMTLDDLSAEPVTYTRAGRECFIPSQLDQLLMTLDRNVQAHRKAAKHSVHDMNKAAGVPCGCRQCSRPQPAVTAAPEVFHVEHETENQPF